MILTIDLGQILPLAAAVVTLVTGANALWRFAKNKWRE